jgi:hypothetical protein
MFICITKIFHVLGVSKRVKVQTLRIGLNTEPIGLEAMKRRLGFMQRVIRMPDDRLPKRVLDEMRQNSNDTLTLNDTKPFNG